MNRANINTAQAVQPMSWPSSLGYAVPVFAVSAPVFLIQTYFLNFATDVLLMAPATVGLLIAAMRIWDGVSDPMVGYWSDRSQNAQGKRRPWMLASAPLLPIVCIGVWSPPVLDSDAAAVAWMAISLFLFYTLATVWSVPHTALGIDMTSGGRERTRVFGIRFIASIAGVIGAFGVMQFIVNEPVPREAAQQAALVALPFLVVALLLPPLLIRERRVETRSIGPPFAVLRSLSQNSAARTLFGGWFLVQSGMVAQATVAPYMSIYVIERPDLIGVLPACFIGAMIFSVPIWVWLGRFIAHVSLLRITLLCAGISYLPLLLLDSVNVWLAFVVLSVAGFFSGGAGPLAPTLLAAVVDEDERASGEPRAATYSAMWELIEKVAGAGVVLIVALTLQLSGYVPNQPLSEMADLGLRLCLAVLPAMAFISAAWVMAPSSDAVK